ncbi:MAG: hypothetical protein GTO18_07580 [Anaerolineales bacterium]|nr:hypothetical protein [Anaerolineales bacterium]
MPAHPWFQASLRTSCYSFWVGAPHFFRSGKLVVLYLGSGESLLNALEAVLGPQFAGR